METRGEDVDDRNPDRYTMQYKLPDGVNCPNGCMLQWTWWTAHTCIQECEHVDVCGPYARGLNKVVYHNEVVRDICGKFPAVGEKPQMFQNCVDIAITPANGGSLSAPTVGSPTDMVEESDEFEEEFEDAQPDVAPMTAGDGDQVVGLSEQGTEASGPCGDNCCPSATPDCMCGNCGVLEPGQVIQCAMGSPQDCCGDNSMGNCMPDEGVSDSVGGAGSMMHCDNVGVVENLMSINSLREGNALQVLECDEKATGTAVLWSEIECGAYVFFRSCNCSCFGSLCRKKQLISLKAPKRAKSRK